MSERVYFPDGAVAVLISSRTASGLRREATALAGFVRRDPAVTPVQLSELVAATRSAQPWRALLRVRGREGLLTGLEWVASGGGRQVLPEVSVHVGHAESRSPAMIFPGQGGQHPGMGRELYKFSAAYRNTVDRIDAQCLDERMSIRSYLLDAVPSDLVQPALFSHMLGLHALWREWGVTPAMVVGHSQGEVAAACAAGLITEEEAAQVIVGRAGVSREYALKGRYEMLLIGARRDQIERLLPTLPGWAEVCAVNSPSQHVVTGELGAVRALEKMLTEEEFFLRRIEVDFPSHTHLMDPSRQFLEASFGHRPFREPQIPFIGSTLGGPIPEGWLQGAYWFANLRHRVRFDLAIESALDQGASSFIELSAHPALLVSVAETAATANRPDILTTSSGHRDEPVAVGFADRLAEVLVSHREIAIWRPDRPPSVPLRFPPTAWEPEVLWAPADSSCGTPGRNGAVPQRLGESWQPLGGHLLPAPRRVLLHCGSEEWVRSLREAAERLGAEVVAEEPDVLVVMVEPGGGQGHRLSSTLADLHRQLETLRGSSASDLLIVTRGAEDRRHLGGEAPDPIAAATAAMARCMAADFHPRQLRHLDVGAADDLASASRHIMTAAHIGSEWSLAVLEGGLHSRRLVIDQALSDRQEYAEAVILGGTGVVGLEICRRLAEQGCRRLVVVSRRTPQGLSAAALQAISNANGTEVVHQRCDVTDPAAIQNLASSLPECSGPRLVVHCVVNYEAVADSDWDAALKAKSGAVPAIREYLLRPEDRLMVFSSLSAGIGARNHAVYAATNRVLEVLSLADNDRTTVIRWGLWPHHGHTGAVVRSLEDIEKSGLRPMDPSTAVAIALASPPGLVSIAAAHWEQLAGVFSLIGAHMLFEHLVTPPSNRLAVEEVRAEPVQHRQEQQGKPLSDSGAEEIATTIEAVVRETLGYSADAELERSTSLVSLGIDSTQALSLQRALAAVTGNAVTAADILRGASLHDLITVAVKE